MAKLGLTALTGAGVIGYSGGSVAAGGSCTVQVDVTGTIGGVKVNTTGDLTSSLGNSGTASASITLLGEQIFSDQFESNP